jgi:hypothetical protein
MDTRTCPHGAEQVALLEPMTDIMAARTCRCRAETILILKAVEAGADLATGMTRERAVLMLTESIVFYEQMLRRCGLGLDGRLSRLEDAVIGPPIRQDAVG